MKRIPKTWLRLAFYLHNKSIVEHAFCHFFPYLNLTSIFYNNHSLIWRKQLFPVFFCSISLLLTKKHSCLSISRSNQIILLKYTFSEPIFSPVISNSNFKKFLSSVMVKLWANVLFLFDFTRRNRRFVSSIVRRGFLLLNPMFQTKSIFWNFLMIDLTMVWLTEKSLTLFCWLFPAWLSFIIVRLVWKGISGNLRPQKLNDLLYKRQKVNTGMTYTCVKCRDLSFIQYI